MHQHRGLASWSWQAQLRIDRRTFLRSVVAVAGVALVERRSATGSAELFTFYVSAEGSNSNDGLSRATPWRDLTPVNATALRPGNTILFRGGDTFTGRIFLDGDSLPSGAAPITFGSFGRRRATLTNTDDCALYAYNPTCGIRIRGLRFLGPGPTAARTAGVLLYRDVPGRSSYVRISDCAAEGWTVGVSIGGWLGGGYDDVWVTDTSLSHNRDTGLGFFGAPFLPSAPAYANTNVYVGACTATDNKGNPADSRRNSGSGIVLGSVDGGLVDGCSTSANGALCTAAEGPVGIWAYDSYDVTIQSSVSFANETGGSADGDGFDLDINCSSCTVQYNLAFDNAGAGILLYGGADTLAHTGNVVRYNLLWGNAKRNPAYGEVLVAGSVNAAEIYNNTMVAGAVGVVESAAVSVWEGPSGVWVGNNILMTAGTGPIVKIRGTSSGSALFQGNSYHSTGAFAIDSGGSTYDSVEAWTQACGQELLDGKPSGITGDPGLVNSAVCPTPANANGLRLRAGSPLRVAGLAVAARGSRDYFGSVLSSPVSVGGHELWGRLAHPGPDHQPTARYRTARATDRSASTSTSVSPAAGRGRAAV